MSHDQGSTPADRFGMVLKVALPTFILTLPFALVIGAPVLFTAVIVVVAIGGMMLFASVGVRVCAWLLYHDDPEYQELRARGIHPYWDFVPWPFNSYSEMDTREEPADGLATNSCPSCGVSVKEPWVGCFFTGVRCWNCQKAMRACPHCFNLVGEPVVGGFDSPQGVQCPFCGRVMRPVNA